MFIIIKERMFVNTKYEQIFETFVCVPVGFMVKFICDKHYVGVAWYQKKVTIPADWKGESWRQK